MKEGGEWKSEEMTSKWKGEGGREGRGCWWESGSEGGIRMKVEVEITEGGE